VAFGLTLAAKVAVLLPLADDEYRIALYADRTAVSDLTERYTPNGEVPAGGGYESGGQRLEGVRFVRDGPMRTVSIVADSPVWPKATITAAAALIYNVTRGGLAMATYDLRDVTGRPVSTTESEFTLPITSAGFLILE
jgi:hypothetical protein